MTTFEGGQRVPCIMQWPGYIPAKSVCRELTTTLDLLPAMACLTGAPLPSLALDGKNIWPLLQNAPLAKIPHEAFYFYRANDLQAVRSGPWKLYLPHTYITPVAFNQDGTPGKTENKDLPLSLYHLEQDIQEKVNLAAQYPDIVQHLLEQARDFDTDLKQNVRPPGQVEL